MEQSPRSTAKGNFPSLGSSSVPFRIRDMKEKMEASRRTSQSADASQRSKDQTSMNIKKQLNARCPCSSGEGQHSEKRGGLTSIGNRSYEKQKEHNDVKISRDLPNTQKRLEKKSSSRRHSEVLRLNNQKQNCAFSEEEENFGPSSADPGKELSSSRAKTTSKKKPSINGDTQSGGSVAQKTGMMQGEKSVKCNVAFEDDSKWDGFDKKNSLDVVSFTFTSPIKKSGAGSNSCGTTSEASSSSFLNCDPSVQESDFRNSAATSSGFNVIGGDALSVLLEQKLKELTSRVEMSQNDLSEAASFSNSGNSYGNIGPTINLVKSLPVDNDTCKSKLEIQYSFGCPSTDNHGLKAGKEKMKVHSCKSEHGRGYIERDVDNSNIEYRRNLHLQGSISFSSQPSLSGASSDSFNVDRSPSNEGPLTCLSLGSYEGRNWSSTRKSHTAEDDVDISDTASTLSVGVISENVYSSLYMIDSKDSSNWEVQYIRDILCCTELLLEDFALGQAHRIIAPEVFDQLENEKMDYYKEMEEQVLGETMVGDDLYREISGWRNDEELMVDKVVDKDMSCKNGKWTDLKLSAQSNSRAVMSRDPITSYRSSPVVEVDHGG
ncbi:hypothetical protein DH2020_047243 [Rehmannia glutinosa]|uniref:DUF4378 domain-containing protein n=1 Tax=Rehmannia glutinosa TaxID=99300 RepID=A0ABR0U907_REHGL